MLGVFSKNGLVGQKDRKIRGSEEQPFPYTQIRDLTEAAPGVLPTVGSPTACAMI